MKKLFRITSLLVAVTTVGVIALPSASAAAAGTVPQCTRSQLHVAVKRDFLTTGSFYFKIVFTNTSGSECWLDGYPAVSAYKSGSTVGRPAQHDTSVTAQKKFLQPKAFVVSRLDEIDVTAFSAKQCKPVSATALKITAPGLTKAVIVKHPLGACSTTKPTSPVFLYVRPVR